MKLNRVFLVLFTVALITGCNQDASVKQSNENVKHVSNATELKNKMDNHEVLVVHTLNAQNYSTAHIPGAINVDYEKMTEASLPSDKNQGLVFYCAGPQCPVSKRAASKAASWGYKNVYVYEGGIKDWRDSGMKVASGS